MSISKRNEAFEWYAMMMGVLSAMPKEERDSLEYWETLHLNGKVATSDWPGWLKYIGPKPQSPVSKKTPKAAIPQDLRWSVWLRDDFTCRKCSTRSNLSVDHIKPESLGGKLEMDNLQTLCRPCNSRKGTSFE